jgi:hypothetical protein
VCPLARWRTVPGKTGSISVRIMDGLGKHSESGSLPYPWNDGIMKIDSAEGRWDITGEQEGEGLRMTVAIIFPVRETDRIAGIVQMSHRKAKKG